MIAAILLAAGRSSRMGQPKGLLSWEGKPLFLHQLEQLRASCLDQIIVVLGHQPESYQPLIDPLGERCTVIYNEQWSQGKSLSILKGLDALPASTEGILFVNIDQPLSATIIEPLLASFENTRFKIHIPIHQGRKGHPILVSAELLAELRSISEDTQGLKSIVRAYEKQTAYVEMEDSSILYNFNTPMDYKCKEGSG